MQHKNYIKIKLRQSVWLLLAFFCVVFSGAIKKVLQLHADQKISMLVHRDNDGSRLLTQNIKDGSREKHEIQVLVASDHKQIPARDFVPLFHTSILQVFSTRLNLYRWIASRTSYNNHESIASGPVAVYLLLRKLQV